MNRLDTAFQNLQKKRQKAFVAYITAGDPDLPTTLKIMELLVEEGVDVIELGVPFSDPIGDGPVNQAALERGIRSNTSLSGVLKTVQRFRKNHQTPVIIFSYMNPVFQMGYASFAKKARLNGADGVLIVDGPFDMCTELRNHLREKNIHCIYLVAPTTREQRIHTIADHCGGFIYCVSSLGVTGIRKTVNHDLSKRIKQLKKISSKPVCIGFGISSPETAKEAAGYADGIIVGSALVKIIGESGASPDELLMKLRTFVRSLVQAIK
ncbi:MAG: tryptophan synthase subunit alpha [Candidatus Aureabacteria bacterium]|nr:tryptophan synthase subunit alpha [Candidatus Auribacterota bacterium]